MQSSESDDSDDYQCIPLSNDRDSSHPFLQENVGLSSSHNGDDGEKDYSCLSSSMSDSSADESSSSDESRSENDENCYYNENLVVDYKTEESSSSESECDEKVSIFYINYFI